MPGFCARCWWRIAFRGYGCRDVDNRDLRQLLWHRHRLVQMRTRVMNQLQAVALNEDMRRKKQMSEQRREEQQLESFQLMGPWATRRMEDLLELLDGLTPRIAALTELTQAIEKQVEKSEAQGLTHPGVGALTALAYVLIIGQHGTFSLRQAGRQLSGTGALRGLQCATGDGWDTSANRATPFCAFFWWKRPRLRCAVTRNGAIATSTWCYGEDERSPKSPWREDSQCVCTGCGARDGITGS